MWQEEESNPGCSDPRILGPSLPLSSTVASKGGRAMRGLGLWSQAHLAQDPALPLSGRVASAGLLAHSCSLRLSELI